MDIYNVLNGDSCMVVSSDTKGPSRFRGHIVVILDRSGSMGQYYNAVPRDLKTSLKENGYNDTDTIDLITFDSVVEHKKLTVGNLTEKLGGPRGSTRFNGALVTLKQIIKPMDNIKLITISDGIIDDKDLSVNTAASLVSSFAGKHVESYAIRLKTSSDASPDTRALAAVLQFDSTGKPASLVDVQPTSPSDENAITSVLNGFLSNTSQICIESPTACLKANPWSTPTNKVFMNDGSLLFMTQVPAYLKINDRLVKDFNKSATDPNIDAYYSNMMNSLVSRVKVLMVNNTDTSRTEIGNMIAFFTKLDEFTAEKEAKAQADTTTNQNGLKARLARMRHMIKRDMKGIANTLSQVINVGKTTDFRNAQKVADYLRDLSTVSDKAISRNVRAMPGQEELLKTIRDEFNAISANFKEISDIDGSTHLQSFYSLGTTFESLQLIAEMMVKDRDVVDNMSVPQLLQCVCVVGVACYSEKRILEDPYLYVVNEMFPCYTSVSDITSVPVDELYPPGFNKNNCKPIRNVVPIFCDPRIKKFMTKYCPTVLDMNSGIGMQGILSVLPGQFKANCNAGFIHCSHILTQSLSTFINEIFARLEDNLNYDASNAIVNNNLALPPTTNYVCLDNTVFCQLLPSLRKALRDIPRNYDDITRSCYALQTYHLTKKLLKVEGDTPANVARNILMNLLGVNFAIYDLGEAFTPTQPFSFPNTYTVNNELLGDLTKYFPAIEEQLRTIHHLVNGSDTVVPDFVTMANLANVQKFRLYYLVQAFLYPNQPARYDATSGLMTIQDIKTNEIGETMITSWLESQYKAEYDRVLREKTLLETAKRFSRFMTTMKSCTFAEFVQNMRNGINVDGTVVKISDTTSYGFDMFRSELTGLSNKITDRAAKLSVLLLGRDINDMTTPVWNGGNVLRGNVGDIRGAVKMYPSNDDKYSWTNLYLIFGKNCMHTYNRDELNRHGHGKEFPSYLAYGYQSLDAFIENEPTEVVQQYFREHGNCCGTCNFTSDGYNNYKRYLFD